MGLIIPRLCEGCNLNGLYIYPSLSTIHVTVIHFIPSWNHPDHKGKQLQRIIHHVHLPFGNLILSALLSMRGMQSSYSRLLTPYLIVVACSATKTEDAKL